MDLKPLFNINKYTNYLLCLFDIELTNNYYFKSFLNELIIEFFKMGEDRAYLKDLEPKELKKELEDINNIYFKGLFKA